MIEYCLSNIDEEVRCQLNHADVETTEYTCLEHCGICYARPFLLADGRIKEGQNHEEIFNNLEKVEVE
ncbi:Uncharacterized protein YuzB, UPF0349 family [Haladaptatus litoreus]|uniref:Uncharacterized protein YuzB, UPF0349 family n=1 Tax=Haladaptatus litoreus TaxID=553468 RepID=A0A1N7DG02_9EURY|nr:DUF1450 domain-containing protein [Haladaptatus litoreus]SIR74756.1 Uncharacterized protein YuzB, UPF0349 family [Haladaptatus litoreus]